MRFWDTSHPFFLTGCISTLNASAMWLWYPPQQSWLTLLSVTLQIPQICTKRNYENLLLLPLINVQI